MKRPSFTINTLEKLSHEYPECNFSLIIGADNWSFFDKWKDYNKITENYKIIIYPRHKAEVIIPESLQETIILVNAPIIEISSTFIRHSIKEGRNIRAFLLPEVFDYIESEELYRHEKP